MNARLFFAARRQAPPAIVPYLIDAFDRCDPTRSREQKPSVRMREARHVRRLLRAVMFACLAIAGLLAVLFSIH